ncbi:centromere protein K isoform X2 [Tachyglossus aculeatus]|uniref:centromere protein K isoform X2 n=1 Tax=Tachyglossus aculeatus TaxID=9261 RepID=UPI0018F6F4C3|nr:centromere protein K isoform X2 [Tachyglossus aculeatus]
MEQQEELLKGAERLAKRMSVYQQELAPDITANAKYAADAKEALINECEELWKQMEECQNKLSSLGPETLTDSDAQLSLLILRVKGLTAERNQWQKRTPEIPNNQDILSALGKEELQKLDQDLEMVLSAVQAQNMKLKEDLRREQQWLNEQEQLVESLKVAHDELKTQEVHFSEQRAVRELKSKMIKIKAYKEELLSALGEFLDNHFPLPEEDENVKKKKKKKLAEPTVQLITLHEILEILISKLLTTPHEPYVAIAESFWPPYIELLLRSGIALRHPEDPNRIRLEAFHQ